MKAIRIIATGLACSLGAWVMGMFLCWQVYPFWQTGVYIWDGANMTRYFMLWLFIAGCLVRWVLED